MENKSAKSTTVTNSWLRKKNKKNKQLSEGLKSSGPTTHNNNKTKCLIRWGNTNTRVKIKKGMKVVNPHTAQEIFRIAKFEDIRINMERNLLEI